MQLTDIDPCLVVPVPFGTQVLNTSEKSQLGDIPTSVEQFVYYSNDPEAFHPLDKLYSGSIDRAVIGWFKKKERICCESSFRFATREDIPALLKLSRLTSKDKKAAFYRKLLTIPNHFVLVAERENSEREQITVGMIHYCFAVYESKTKDEKSLGDCPTVLKNESSGESKVVHVLEFQLLEKKMIGKRMSNIKMESEPGTARVLFSLLCEHGRSVGMKWVLAESDFKSVPYYQHIGGMKVVEHREAEKCFWQLCITHFDYKKHANGSTTMELREKTASAGAGRSKNSSRCKVKCKRDRTSKLTKTIEQDLEKVNDGQPGFSKNSIRIRSRNERRRMLHIHLL